MKTYEAIFNPKANKGVFAISLVNQPAMEGTFIALSKNEPVKFVEVNKEQQILLGLVLEPNKNVYRNQNGKEFNMFFSADTIKELSHNFFRSGFHKNSTIEHSKDTQLEGVTFVESWIVENPKVDKSTNFGFSYPKGSWMVSMKVDDDNLWNEFVKSGEVKGFSIDALLDLKEVNIKTEIQMSEIIEANKSVIDAIVELGKDIKALFVPEKKEPIKVEFGSIKSGDLEIMFDGETMAVGGAVWMENEEGEKVMLPANTYDIEGDRKLVVVEEGVIAEIQEGTSEPVEEVPAEMEAEAPAATEPTSGEAEAVNKVLKSLLMKFKNEIELSFNEKIKENNKLYLSKIESLEKQVIEFGAQPKAEKIVSKSIDFSKMTNFQKMQYRKQNG